MPRRVMALVATLVVAAAMALGTAATAHAAAYRYWTYWQGGTGTWVFATAGPASLIPAEGSVEGWRFAVTTTAGGAADAPTVSPSFDAICGGTAAEAGSKRVALVVDPGSPAIAPESQTPPAPITTCVVAELDATGYQVLRAVTSVRTDGGLICAIGDYPTGECAPVVDDPVAPAATTAATPAATTAMDVPEPAPDSSSGGAPWITAAVVLVLVVVGVLLWRRRRVV